MPPSRTILAALALALVPAGALAAGTNGWHGKTSQGQAMELSVSRSGTLVRLAQTHYRLTCSDDSSQVSGFGVSIKGGDTVPIDADGRYAVSGTLQSGVPGKGNGTATYHFKGRVTAPKVTGSLRVDFILENGMTCSSGRVTYTLR
ncbi:MAG: hypothetical protein JWM73_1027 [Solirubrobacterales bacterium]|nr:hypothetical protein [Solirubrobacterales bacterium]